MREGCPDPLIYYLHAAALAHTQVIAGLAAPDDLPQDALKSIVARANSENMSPWDMAEASSKRLSDMIAGIEKWRVHPYRRAVQEPPVIWQSGGARMLDYGLSQKGQPVLVVPSLINKPYILDLMQEASFLRHLTKSGLRPVLLDWGAHNAPGTPQTIDGYITDILHPAFSNLAAQSDGAPGLLGYCMGGTLAAGYAALMGQNISKLALIGAPWDFSKLRGIAQTLQTHTQTMGIAKTRTSLLAMGQHFGAVPAQVFQQLFAVLSPMQVVQKFSNFANLDAASAQAQKFVAVEDWLADGVSVNAPAAETILLDWYVNNQTALGHWEIMGKPVDPAQITCPTLLITGDKDHIVPTQVASALMQSIPTCTHHPVDMGHVGMIIGTRAHAQVTDRISVFFDAG